MKTEINRYLTRIYWSDDDEAYVAEAPALPGCVAHGATMQQAAKEMGIAMRLWLGSARKHGDSIPEPDLAREEIERFAPILSVAKLARRAGINQHTLASKLRRKSAFTKDETRAILRALEPV
jgi:predicted RNase H-like HicB family nuclease